MLLKQSQYNLTPCLTTLLTALKNDHCIVNLLARSGVYRNSPNEVTMKQLSIWGVILSTIYSQNKGCYREREQVETVLFDKYREYKLQGCYLLVYFRTVYMYILHK